MVVVLQQRVPSGWTATKYPAAAAPNTGAGESVKDESGGGLSAAENGASTAVRDQDTPQCPGANGHGGGSALLGADPDAHGSRGRSSGNLSGGGPEVAGGSDSRRLSAGDDHGKYAGLLDVRSPQRSAITRRPVSSGSAGSLELSNLPPPEIARYS